MSLMGNFKKLAVWQKAYVLSLAVYRETKEFPGSERYGMTAQLRSAALSVPSNIAEGCARRGDGDLIRFLNIARGSIGEVECQLMLSRDLGYLNPAAWAELNDSSEEISRMLGGLINSLRSKTGGKTKYQGKKA